MAINTTHTLINDGKGRVLEIPRDATMTSLPRGFSDTMKDPHYAGAAQLLPIGSKLTLADGRIFRYALNGATGLAVGVVAQAAVPLTNHRNMDVTAGTVAGDTEITVTLGATAVTENQYANGYVHIDAGTGNGHTYQIKSHPAADSAATLKLTLWDPLVLAIASGKATITPNRYRAVVVTPVTTATAARVGVTPRAITAAHYGWLQTWGPASVLTVGTLVIGDHCVSPTGTSAGAVGPQNSTLAVKETVVGDVLSVNATTTHSLIDLRIRA